MILVKSEHLNSMRIHAEKTYPEEGCGLLLGTIKDEEKILIEVRETENSWNSEIADYLSPTEKVKGGFYSKQNRFSIAPESILQVQKEGRDRDLVIIGIYHSHPNCAAIPSEFDRAIAHPQYSYIIISVQQGRATDVLSWTLDQGDQFQAEQIVTTG